MSGVKKNFYAAGVLSLIFFIAGFLTLKDYNISWDEPTHFKRGQTYLWYFLTGEKNYQSLPKYNLDQARNDSSYHERSYYQDEAQSYSFWLTKAGGDHPPLNGILASFSNYIFYQKLGWLGDIEAYHLFEVFVSALAVAVVFLFASQIFGTWAAIYSSVFLATYPLFWAESHFNIKDPIETTFFTAAAYCLWRGLTQNRLSSFLWGALWVSFAFSTKLNIIFLPIILACWLVARRIFLKLSFIKIVLTKNVALSFIIFPVLSLVLLFAIWPYLWQNPWTNLMNMFGYYREMGTEASFKTHFIFGSWSSFAIKWISYTTPVVLLVSALAGLISIFFWTKERKDLLLLWIIWLILTITRVSLPNMSIYGGVRQIMEYIPPLALIGGVGIVFIQTKILKINKNYLYYLTLAFILIINISLIWRFHPNENVYFNFLSGGLKNQIKEGLPSAGNTFGNAYLPGIEWLNQNVEQGGKVAMVQALAWNIPSFKLRPDIKFANSYWSGISREGEYMIDLIYNYDVKVYLYCWEYVEKMLNPVYEVKVGDTAILKIWKNDLAHTKPEYQKQEAVYQNQLTTQVNENFLKITLPEKVLLSRLIVNYSPSSDCVPLKGGYVHTSLDNQNWQKEGDSLTMDQMGKKYILAKNSLRYMFAARDAQYIEVETDNVNSCLLKEPKIELVVLQ